MNELPGQILLDSDFGKLLAKLARQCEVIVEIGTWNGRGSTKCLADGLVRDSQQMFSIEADKAMFDSARKLHSGSRIVFLNGTVSEMNDVLLVASQLPDKIDLLLIDGGDKNGAADFDALIDRVTGFIALDDTAPGHEKNSGNRARLIQSGWKVIADNLTERNGFAVFQKTP